MGYLGSLLCYVFSVYITFILIQLFSVQELDLDQHFSKEPLEWPPSETVANYKTVTLKDLDLTYIESAPSSKTNGKCVLFLHGFPESALEWRKYIPHFQKEGWHVLAPDQRYFNNSQPGENARTLTLELLAEDMANLLDKVSPCEKSVVVSHDWGAGVGWAFATLYPEKTEMLTVISVPHLEVYRYKNTINLPIAIQKVWYFMFFGLMTPIAEWKLAQNDYSWAYYFLQGSSEPHAYSLEEMETYKTMWKKSMDTMLNWYKMGNKWLLLGVFPWTGGVFGSMWYDGTTPTTVPTLYIHGDHDAYVEPALGYLSLQCVSNPKKKLVFYDASHWIVVERPNELISEIEKFYGELEK